MINSNLTTYLDSIDNLRHLVRYQTAPRVSSETVAEHSYFVSAYILKLHDYYEFDLTKALRMGLLHDFSEVFISDVPHPIKKQFPLINDELNKAEHEVNVNYISEEFANELEEFNELSTAEGVMVALADIISVVSYSKYEINLGNSKYMKEVYNNAKRRYMEVLDMATQYIREGVCTHDIVMYIDDFVNK